MTAATRRTAPRKQPQQARSAATRERILEAAARIFAERGYASGTTNHIAEAAGLSVGSLYQYFPNKDAILVELTRAHLHEGTAALAGRLVDGLPPDLDGRLRTIVEALVAAHAGDHRLHQVLFEEAPRPPDLLAELRSAERDAIAMAERLLMEDPEVHVDDPALAARMVVTTIESLTHRFVAREGADLDAAAFVDEVVLMLGRYLRGSTPSAVSGPPPCSGSGGA